MLFHMVNTKSHEDLSFEPCLLFRITLAPNHPPRSKFDRQLFPASSQNRWTLLRKLRGREERRPVLLIGRRIEQRSQPCIYRTTTTAALPSSTPPASSLELSWVLLSKKPHTRLFAPPPLRSVPFAKPC